LSAILILLSVVKHFFSLKLNLHCFAFCSGFLIAQQRDPSSIICNDDYLWTFSCEVKSSSHLFSSVRKSASARFLLHIASSIGLSECTDRVRLPPDDLTFFSDIGLGSNDWTRDLQV
jgi:hypothetical protein